MSHRADVCKIQLARHPSSILDRKSIIEETRIKTFMYGLFESCGYKVNLLRSYHGPF